MTSMPLSPGHHDVHQDHVGLLRAGLEDRVAAAARLADDLDVRLGLEHQAQARRGRRRGRRRSGRGSLTASGTSTTIVVPAAGRRLDLQRAVEERDSLAHPEQP